MSKSLKKLIDINRLREFKNKLVGTGSAYVQTGAVDQTVAGTKTFLKPILGSVTGSSGSCTGNAATATTATTAQACTGNAATATKLATARSLWGNDFDGSAAITGAIVGTPAIELMPAATANNGGYLDFHYNQSTADYTSRIIEFASGMLSINDVTITTGRVVTAATFNGALKGNVTGNCSGSSGSCTGNAATATKLATARTIALGGAATGTATGFDGSGNITIPVTSLDASKLTGTASVSTTGNAATATKAVSADSATNASHATSADKATKAEQDGNGNNIVASYVAAGSEDSTTDIGAFMAARPSFIKSFTYNNVWTDAISMRHRNGSGDGPNYGTYIRSSNMTGVSNLLWNHQSSGTWQGERTLVDSANLAGFILSMVYPVGSVYISVNDVSPEKFLGGTWIKISQGRVLQGASGTQTAGTEVSAGLPNISVSWNGEHTHTRGSMNITGSVVMHGADYCSIIGGVGGAFSGLRKDSGHDNPICAGGAPSYTSIDFSADRTWTGSTSSDGAHSHDAYITGITGNSTTVQPPALLVNIWKRTA